MINDILNDCADVHLLR